MMAAFIWKKYCIRLKTRKLLPGIRQRKDIYDDKDLMAFNYKEGAETAAFGEAVKAEKNLDMSM